MIRCVRIWTGDDGNSLFEEGFIDLAEGMRGDAVGKPVRVVELSFQETRSGGSYQWHQDPVTSFVTGTLIGDDPRRTCTPRLFRPPGVARALRG